MRVLLVRRIAGEWALTKFNSTRQSYFMETLLGSFAARCITSSGFDIFVSAVRKLRNVSTIHIFIVCPGKYCSRGLLNGSRGGGYYGYMRREDGREVTAGKTHA